MKLKIRGSSGQGFPTLEAGTVTRWRFLRQTLICCALLTVVTAAAQTVQPPTADQSGNLPNAHSALADNSLVAANEPQIKPQPDRPQQIEPQNPDAANAERKLDLAGETAVLLKLATELKAEVDKTNKDILSLAVIRKASEIERLAGNVKEGKKVTAGAN